MYIQQRYEVQILDSFGLTGEPNQCGGLTGSSHQTSICVIPRWLGKLTISTFERLAGMNKATRFAMR